MNGELSALPNGVRVVSIPMKDRKSVAMGIWVHVGGRDEEPQDSGISHFLEHMVFKGTAKRTANQIKESVEGIGGSLNAFTGEEYTCFLAKVSERHFEKVFEVLSDMVLNASLKESDVTKERTVIMEEIKMTQDQPSQLVDEILCEIVWPCHALGRPLAGTLETVSSFNREKLLGYKNKFYKPNFITLVAAGAVNMKDFLSASENYFSLPRSEHKKNLELFKPSQSKPCLKLFPKETEQTHLALALHGFEKDHPEEYALDLLSVILGGNMSSRLFNEVREERGLAYEIGTTVKKYEETGAFVVEAGVDPGKTSEAVQVIMGELDKILAKPVPAEELLRAKEFYLGQLELSLENSMNQMLWAGENLVCLNRRLSYEEIRKKIEAVTPEELTNAAGKIFRTPSLNLALVGPKVDQLEKSLLKNLSFSNTVKSSEFL